MAALLGHSLEDGGAAFLGSALWCRPKGGQVVVICRPEDSSRLLGQLRKQAMRCPDLSVSDRSHQYASIGVIGASAPGVLAALGAYGPESDPHGVSPAASGRVAGVDVFWLLESDNSALVLAPRSAGIRVWKAIEDAGRPFHISCIGRDAFDRYMMLRRTRVRVASSPGRF